MDYRATSDALASCRLDDENFSYDDSQLERLMRIERGQLTGDEAVAEIFAEREYKVVVFDSLYVQTQEES